MTDKITFQTQDVGYAPQEVDAFVDLILENYEELLAHYQSQQDQLEKISKALAKTTKELKEQEAQAKAQPQPQPQPEPQPVPDEPDYNAQALELLSETSKVVAQTRAQARTKITTLIDQAALHAYRLEDAAKSMKDELDKMYATLDEQL